MAKNKFVLNRRAVKEQIHNGPGMGRVMEEIAAEMQGPGVETEVSQSSDAEGGGRYRARAWGPAYAEAKSGVVSRALGRARI